MYLQSQIPAEPAEMAFRLFLQLTPRYRPRLCVANYANAGFRLRRHATVGVD